MKQELQKHFWAYMMLVMAEALFITAFMGAWPNLISQRIIALAMVIFYFLWGILTHFKTQKITKQVIYEYAGVSILGGLLLLMITL